MKKAFPILVVLSVLSTIASGQNLSPKVIASCGGYFTGGNNSLSWTLGETFTTTLTSPNNKLTQGLQQPEITLVLLNLKAFIEGYYQGGSIMTQVLYNEGLDANPLSTKVDTVTIELHSQNSPYGIAYTTKGLLQTNGTLACRFPVSAMGSSFYIAVRHRTAIQTWSANPVLMGVVTSYDFTTSASKAYGGNQIDTYGENIWSIYTGDLNQDESIDIFDFPQFDFDAQNFLFGYYNTDMNGDGNVDIFDYPIFDGNAQNFVFSAHP